MRLSGATVRAFTHNEMTALEGELQKAVEKGQPGGFSCNRVAGLEPI